MAVGDAYVFPGFLTPVLTTFLSKATDYFSHMRGKITPESKVASTEDRTHNHQVMSPTRSPLSHPGGALLEVELDSRKLTEVVSKGDLFENDVFITLYYS